ncbi:protein tyrosine phosphatase [Cytophagaceae bacterium YF14B1]|uniref:Protein tyrosine phosphatase n=1 Tax=Xanthocytophaga flava TaxID=3048013 RepID=A0AAE3QS52_9BACT|nr:protein tyrosine phosphatase [Xanthocytophaga flavus]MDJ1482216.1 protein tyrosine phosphatase [Xanthocytophaga flavus]
MNILFLCTANKNRSRTAEDYFREHYPQHQFRSAGLSQRLCEKEGTTLVTDQMLEWADRIFVMEAHHQERIQQYTGILYLHKINVLGIEDIYTYMQVELVTLLIRMMQQAERTLFI